MAVPRPLPLGPGEGGDLQLDTRIGGSFTERWGDNEGAVWGTVLYLERGIKLRLNGVLGMTTLPVNSLYTYELEDDDGGTLLKLTHDCYGRLEEEWADKHDAGWQMLLDTYLRAYVEEGKTRDQVEAAQA